MNPLSVMLLFFAAFAYATTVQGKPACQRCAPDLARECRRQGKICRIQLGQAVCAVPGTPLNPCSVTLCPVGTECVVVPIVCVRAPCLPPEAHCVPVTTPKSAP
ncbi:hypothetical protein AAVH_14040 [Aphelenchoides avenae]|nr:hypothetical protein AAVH_14040 [Aphelenchus avenae]